MAHSITWVSHSERTRLPQPLCKPDYPEPAPAVQHLRLLFPMPEQGPRASLLPNRRPALAWSKLTQFLCPASLSSSALWWSWCRPHNPTCKDLPSKGTDNIFFFFLPFKKILLVILLFTFFFFIRYFLYLHFKCYPLSYFSPPKPS